MKRKTKAQKRWAIALPLALFALLAVPAYAEWTGAWTIMQGAEGGKVLFWHQSHGANPFLEACDIGRDSGTASGKVWVVDYLQNAPDCINSEWYEKLYYENVPFQEIKVGDIAVYSTTDYFVCISYNCMYHEVLAIVDEGQVVYGVPVTEGIWNEFCVDDICFPERGIIVDNGIGEFDGIAYIPESQIFGVAIGAS